jgi:RimJ/RimL family protein N-acetyltransferase
LSDNGENPFHTAAYANAMRALGREVRMLPDALCVIERGRLSVRLEIPSLPPSAARPEFWQGVEELCRQEGVTDIEALSFASPPIELSPLAGEVERATRTEFVLPLLSADQLKLSSNHKRNIRKAASAGVTVRRTRDSVEWLKAHTALMAHSAERRTARGEHVEMSTDIAPYRALLENGAAELFQAVRGEQVLASVLVLRSARMAYYHSAGSSAEGMNLGASHFLLHEIAQILKSEGIEQFNLGGAPEDSTLARFKSGFGALPVRLPRATCYVGPAWKKKMRTAIDLARGDRKRLLRMLTGSSSRLIVFGLNTAADRPPIEAVAGARLEFLNPDELLAVPNPPDDPEFRNRQKERLSRLGQSYAYAVRIGDHVAHISWLIPGAVVAAESPAILDLQKDEAEITCCETPSAFRGKGLYGWAVQQLKDIAREQGFRRIYMKTDEKNISSQRGIAKAGLTELGSIRLIHPPLASTKTLIRRKLRRLD